MIYLKKLKINKIHFRMVNLMYKKLLRLFKISYIWIHLAILAYLILNYYLNYYTNQQYKLYINDLTSKELDSSNIFKIKRTKFKDSEYLNLNKKIQDFLSLEEYVNKMKFVMANNSKSDSAIQISSWYHNLLIFRYNTNIKNQVQSENAIAHFLRSMQMNLEVPNSFQSLFKAVMSKQVTYLFSDIVTNLKTLSLEEYVNLQNSYKRFNLLSERDLIKLYNLNLTSKDFDNKLSSFIIPEVLQGSEAQQKQITINKVINLRKQIIKRIQIWFKNNNLAYNKDLSENLANLILLNLGESLRKVYLQVGYKELEIPIKNPSHNRDYKFNAFQNSNTLILQTLQEFKELFSKTLSYHKFVVNSRHSELISVISKIINKSKYTQDILIEIKLACFYSLEPNSKISKDFCYDYTLLERLIQNYKEFKKFTDIISNFFWYKLILTYLLSFIILYSSLTFIFNVTNLRNTIIRYIYYIMPYQEWISCLFLSNLIILAYFFSLFNLVVYLVNYSGYIGSYLFKPFYEIFKHSLYDLNFRFIFSVISSCTFSFWVFYIVPEYNLVSFYSIGAISIGLLYLFFNSILRFIIFSRYIKLRFSLYNLVLLNSFNFRFQGSNLDKLHNIAYFSDFSTKDLISKSYLDLAYISNYIYYFGIVFSFIFSLFSPFFLHLNKLPIIGVPEYVVVAQ
jgi:hypothetical protein